MILGKFRRRLSRLCSECRKSPMHVTCSARASFLPRNFCFGIFCTSFFPADTLRILLWNFSPIIFSGEEIVNLRLILCAFWITRGKFVALFLATHFLRLILCAFWIYRIDGRSQFTADTLRILDYPGEICCSFSCNSFFPADTLRILNLSVKILA